MAVADIERLKAKIRDVPDWPEEGVVFKDIMPLLADPDSLREVIDVLGDWAGERRPDIVVGAEARGFFVGSAIAYKLGCGFVPARRPGKLPLETISAEYALEYGKNTLELRADAFGDGARVLIHDDVLATGGTAKALAELVEQLGGHVVGLQFIIELDFLGGREKISNYDVFSLIHYQEQAGARLKPGTGLSKNVRRADYKSQIVMYDALTTRYTFPCPARGETRVRLSAFRALDRLPGAGHPAVFQIVFDCPCGCEHPGLVSDVELDWAPLGRSADRFLNLMTDRFESTEEELADLAVTRILAGQWPWTFYCYPERRPRPVFPSSFFLLAPGDGSLGLAVRCPACEHVSVNLVTPEHVDLPFHNDREIGVLQHVLVGDAEEMVEEFRDELDSGRFDARRLDLD